MNLRNYREFKENKKTLEFKEEKKSMPVEVELKGITMDLRLKKTIYLNILKKHTSLKLSD